MYSYPRSGPPRPAPNRRGGSPLSKLMPEDAKEAIGHGVRAKRSKSGAICFDLHEAEADHAALQ
jgi:hypothetical protein